MPQMTDSAGSQLKKYGTGLKSKPIYVKLRPNLESRVTLLFIFVYQLSFYHNQIHIRGGAELLIICSDRIFLLTQ